MKIASRKSVIGIRGTMVFEATTAFPIPESSQEENADVDAATRAH